MKKVLILAAVMLATARIATASTVTFENLSGPSFFDDPAALKSSPQYAFGPLTVTFNGGTILTNESDLQDSGDSSTVYATASQMRLLNVTDPTLANPLTISFSQPIMNFQIEILNAFAGNYVMADENGNSLLFTLADTGDFGVTEGFAASGQQIRIQYLGAGVNSLDTVGVPWDFAIDNVQFNQPLNTAPEPATCALLGTGLAALVARRRAARAKR